MPSPERYPSRNSMLGVIPKMVKAENDYYQSFVRPRVETANRKGGNMQLIEGKPYNLGNTIAYSLEELHLLGTGDQIREIHSEIVRLFELKAPPLEQDEMHEFNTGLVRGFHILPDDVREDPLEEDYVNQSIKYYDKAIDPSTGKIDLLPFYRELSRTDGLYALWSNRDITEPLSPTRSAFFTYGAIMIAQPFYRRGVDIKKGRYDSK